MIATHTTHNLIVFMKTIIKLHWIGSTYPRSSMSWWWPTRFVFGLKVVTYTINWHVLVQLNLLHTYKCQFEHQYENTLTRLTFQTQKNRILFFFLNVNAFEHTYTQIVVILIAPLVALMMSTTLSAKSCQITSRITFRTSYTTNKQPNKANHAMSSQLFWFVLQQLLIA